MSYLFISDTLPLSATVRHKQDFCKSGFFTFSSSTRQLFAFQIVSNGPPGRQRRETAAPSHQTYRPTHQLRDDILNQIVSFCLQNRKEHLGWRGRRELACRRGKRQMRGIMTVSNMLHHSSIKCVGVGLLDSYFTFYYLLPGSLYSCENRCLIK